MSSRPTAPVLEAIAAAHGWPVDECWACGDRCRPQRAHIVPIALEREDNNDPLDFVLLCPTCHTLAPDVADAEYMWAWIDQQQAHHINTFADAVMAAFDRLPVSRERMLAALDKAGRRTVVHQGHWSLATKVWIVQETARILRAERSAQRTGKVGHRRGIGSGKVT